MAVGTALASAASASGGEQEGVGLFLPGVYDVVWTASMVLGVAVVVVALASALVSLGRRAHRMSSPAVALWAVILLAVPVLGAIAWFATGRRTAGTGDPAPSVRTSRRTT